MLKQLVPGKISSLFITSLLSEVLLTTCIPTQAATLGFSQISTQLNDFSHKPNETQTFTDTNTLAVSSPNSLSFATAQADANFFVEPTLAKNNILSSATGEGNSYFGSAQSEAQILGNFAIEAGDTFSFNFIASAESITLKDNSASKESANTSGELSLLLIDTLDPSIIYDSFTLIFNTQVPGINNSLEIQSNNSFSIESSSLVNNFNQNENGAKNVTDALVEGAFSRRFNNSTNITLKEYKKNQVTVQVPEAETWVGSICFLFLIGIKYKGKKGSLI